MFFPLPGAYPTTDQIEGSRGRGGRGALCKCQLSTQLYSPHPRRREVPDPLIKKVRADDVRRVAAGLQAVEHRVELVGQLLQLVGRSRQGNSRYTAPGGRYVI